MFIRWNARNPPTVVAHPKKQRRAAPNKIHVTRRQKSRVVSYVKSLLCAAGDEIPLTGIRLLPYTKHTKQKNQRGVPAISTTTTCQISAKEHLVRWFLGTLTGSALPSFPVRSDKNQPKKPKHTPLNVRFTDLSSCFHPPAPPPPSCCCLCC